MVVGSVRNDCMHGVHGVGSVGDDCVVFVKVPVEPQADGSIQECGGGSLCGRNRRRYYRLCGCCELGLKCLWIVECCGQWLVLEQQSAKWHHPVGGQCNDRARVSGEIILLLRCFTLFFLAR